LAGRKSPSADAARLGKAETSTSGKRLSTAFATGKSETSSVSAETNNIPPKGQDTKSKMPLYQ